ncbi:hypothetical protein PIB30_054731 [Stylosanthes scabra]|uniref:Uncharacterized protein n=1 Tax=Stylosanthes scabra TaxID=79078 RepID=A0ABU6SJR8_9FABA|nr:hypothetical protein [Stylosanthes scabra]
MPEHLHGVGVAMGIHGVGPRPRLRSRFELSPEKRNAEFRSGGSEMSPEKREVPLSPKKKTEPTPREKRTSLLRRERGGREVAGTRADTTEGIYTMRTRVYSWGPVPITKLSDGISMRTVPTARPSIYFQLSSVIVMENSKFRRRDVPTAPSIISS